MTVSAVSPSTSSSTTSSSSSSSASSAYGLDFQSLLQIILTQLTYQDPLKPMDNFEFVSQLAQFSQLQQTQVLNTSVTSLLASQSNMQAVGLLGHKVALSSGSSSSATVITGSVTAVNLSSSAPSVSITTPSGQVQTNVPISNITTVQ